MNDKYKDDLNLNNILQEDTNDLELINKVCSYLSDFYFDIYVNKK